jgi:phosphatidylinositol alpha-1,6-mannosyltransferase
MIGFMRRLASRGYDFVLVSHALPVGTAAWLSRLLGGPRYVVLLHGLDLRLASTSMRKAWILRRVLKSASLVVANSEFVAREIQAFESCIQPLVLTPGVESMAFPARAVARQRLATKEETLIILSVTRLVPRKGIDRLIEAMASLPSNVQLVVVGDGEDRHRLEHMAVVVQDRVTFIPHASDQERNAWYAAADIFALPVRDEGSDVEGFGIVYLEAAAAGLPVVAGKSGGASEAVIDQKTGLLVDPNDGHAITQAIKKLIEDPELRRRLGEAGKERVEREFGWEERWQRLQEKLV